MSEIAEAARVAVFLADYAGNDPGGRINALGVGWALAPLNPQTGVTSALAAVAIVSVPPQFYGAEYAIEVTLRREDGRAVEMPGPTGEPQALRLAQNIRAEEPTFPPGSNVPRGKLWSQMQVVMGFSNGLPLVGGQLYSFTVGIDSTSKPDWAASFYVPGPPSGPVFGGPAGPADIPGLHH